MADAYPLQWPIGRPRSKYRERNVRFGKSTSMDSDTRKVLRELQLLGGSSVVISTNVELRKDGYPFSGRRASDDPGVAVYFVIGKETRCLACDLWDKVEHNLHAVALYVEATRAQLRNGVGTAEQAFAGFKALPDPSAGPQWWTTLGVERTATVSEIEAAFRTLAKQRHPDAGGSKERFQEIGSARANGIAERMNQS